MAENTICKGNDISAHQAIWPSAFSRYHSTHRKGEKNNQRKRGAYTYYLNLLKELLAAMVKNEEKCQSWLFYSASCFWWLANSHSFVYLCTVTQSQDKTAPNNCQLIFNFRKNRFFTRDVCICVILSGSSRRRCAHFCYIKQGKLSSRLQPPLPWFLGDCM